MLPYSELRAIQDKLCGSDTTLDLRVFPYWTLQERFPYSTQMRAHLPVGTFYRPFNTLTVEEVTYLKQMMEWLPDTELIYVPHLRQNDPMVTVLVDLGWCLIDIEGESIVQYQHSNYQTYLPCVIGKKRFKDHMRLWRNAQNYSLKHYHIHQLIADKTLFQRWLALFAAHESKYSNTISVYGEHFLEGISKVTYCDEYAFYFRWNSDSIIQVFLTRQTNDNLFLIASATDPIFKEKGINLYTSMIMDMLIQKDQSNLSRLHLGRGNPKTKKRYGATVYFPHVHAIFTKNEQAFTEMMKGDNEQLCGM